MEQNETKEILKAIGGLSDKIDTEVGSLSEQITEQASYVDKRFDGVDKRFDGIDKRLNKIEATMVTKDYLDDKFADFKAELSDTGGKAEQHVKRLAVTLQKNGVITTTQFRQVFET